MSFNNNVLIDPVDDQKNQLWNNRVSELQMGPKGVNSIFFYYPEPSLKTYFIVKVEDYFYNEEKDRVDIAVRFLDNQEKFIKKSKNITNELISNVLNDIADNSYGKFNYKFDYRNIYDNLMMRMDVKVDDFKKHKLTKDDIDDALTKFDELKIQIDSILNPSEEISAGTEEENLETPIDTTSEEIPPLETVPEDPVEDALSRYEELKMMMGDLIGDEEEPVDNTEEQPEEKPPEI